MATDKRVRNLEIAVLRLTDILARNLTGNEWLQHDLDIIRDLVRKD